MARPYSRSGRTASILVSLIVVTACGRTPETVIFDNTLPPTTTAAVLTPAVASEPTAPTATGTGTAAADTTATADGSDAPTASSPATGGPAASAASVAPTTPAVESAWVNATGNLAGLASECGNLSLVKARPGTTEVIASVALQGLWTTSDGGATWAQLGADAPIANRANDIVFDPDDPARFWESGSYNGAGAFRTDDGGATFRALGDVEHNEFMAVDFADPARSTILLGQHEGRSLFLTADGGSTWQDIGTGLPDDVGFAHSPVIVDDDTFLVGTEEGDGDGVFRTTDRGQTWTQVYDGGVTGRLVVTQDGQQWLWLLDAGAGVIASSDRGETWEQVGGPGPAFTIRELFVLPDGRLLTLGNRVLLVSANLGETWDAFGPPLPYDATGLAYSADEGAVYAWRFDCPSEEGADLSVKDDSIIRLALPPS